MESMNPFWPVKFEDEEIHMVFLSDEAKKQFARNNFFYTGKRGCGKTTCLKIADTIFQSKVRAELGQQGDEYSSNHLGVYLNLNLRTIPSFASIPINKQNKAIAKSQEACEQLRFEFLELTLFRVLFSSVLKLSEMKRIEWKVSDEREAVAIVEEAYRLQEAHNAYGLLHQAHRRLSTLVDFSRGVVAELPHYSARLEIPFHAVAGRVLDILKRSNSVSFLRFLIDDCEVFNADYQKVINTLVRTPQNTPVSWSVAYVEGKFNPKDTVINNQTNGRE